MKKICIIFSFINNHQYIFLINYFFGRYILKKVNLNCITLYITFGSLMNVNLGNKQQNRTEQNRTEQNRTEQNRTEQNRTEQNRTEQNRTEQNRTEQNCMKLQQQ